MFKNIFPNRHLLLELDSDEGYDMSPRSDNTVLSHEETHAIIQGAMDHFATPEGKIRYDEVNAAMKRQFAEAVVRAGAAE